MRIKVHYKGSEVTLTLTRTPITLSEYYPTDEGYHSGQRTFWMDELGDVWQRDESCSSDCDGPISSDHLYVLVDGDWRCESSIRHDYFAESAGY